MKQLTLLEEKDLKALEAGHVLALTVNGVLVELAMDQGGSSAGPAEPNVLPAVEKRYHCICGAAAKSAAGMAAHVRIKGKGHKRVE